MHTVTRQGPADTGAYTELRRHELHKTRILMNNGSLSQNARTSESGLSARVYQGGYWGFASAPLEHCSADEISARAQHNAVAMAHFGAQAVQALPGGSYSGEHRFQSRAERTAAECVERLSALHAWCKSQFPLLKSARFLLADEHHRKWLSTSLGGSSLSCIQRAQCYITFTAEDAQGAPVELAEHLSCKGSLADLELSLDALAPLLHRQYEHLLAKRRAVPARAGLRTVVLANELPGMLAHEAMGHPCEADLVLGGAITRDLLGQRVASDLVSMVDVAHTFQGQEAMQPVYVDDEGVAARDAVLIQQGMLTGFMSSRETAARLGLQPTGNARAYGPGDEPLVRMRNTAILPGTHKLEDMVADVEDGYLLLKTSNGQADSTTEFMFGINLAYEIHKGKLGAAVRDTTLSGSAIAVLQTVDAVSDTLHWSCTGYCGKKQPMVVSMGGPALRAQAHIGGA